MRVQHDIANANQAALLVLLDMSAAFDTIYANILIDTLHNRLGVKGTPLKWFRSYLSDRCFAVKVGNSQSADHKLKYGVPQGFVLGPFLSTVYSAATEAILKKHGIKYHKYADDIQIHLFYRPHVPGDLVCAIYRLQACFRELKQLLTTLKLKLNDCKTEFLVLISSESMAYPTFSLVQYSLSLLFQFKILELISIKCSQWLASSITRSKLHHTTCDE